MSAGTGEPRDVEKRRREVDVERHRVAVRARLDRRRPADQERHAQRLLVHEPLVEQAVVAEEESLVARVDRRSCSWRDRSSSRNVEQAADVVVHRLDRRRGSPACSAGTSSGQASPVSVTVLSVARRWSTVVRLRLPATLVSSAPASSAGG